MGASKGEAHQTLDYIAIVMDIFIEQGLVPPCSLKPSSDAHSNHTLAHSLTITYVGRALTDLFFLPKRHYRLWNLYLSPVPPRRWPLRRIPHQHPHLPIPNLMPLR